MEHNHPPKVLAYTSYIPIRWVTWMPTGTSTTRSISAIWSRFASRS